MKLILHQKAGSFVFPLQILVSIPILPERESLEEEEKGTGAVAFAANVM
jgi:hypothetical protein